MIKKIWIVRSRERLFWGLSFAVSGLMLAYTLLTLTVLPGEIPWRGFLFGEGGGTVSRFLLLLLPLLGLLAGGLLLWDARQKRPPLLALGPAPPESVQKRREAAQNASAVAAFLFSLFCFFWQLDRLNFAKELSGFSPFVPLLILAGLLVVIVVSIVQIHRIR